MLILLTAAFRPLAALVQRIPASLATAILAGVLFPFVAATVEGVAGVPALGLPLVAAFVIIRLFSPTWAVIAVLALGIGLSFGLDLVTPVSGFTIGNRFDLTKFRDRDDP